MAAAHCVRIFASLLVILSTRIPAKAHDFWADGSIVPSWVKGQCCGVSDVHHLRPDQVHRNDNGDWTIEGFGQPVPNSRALPSQDGDYWAFYSDAACTSGYCGAPVMRCFFVPLSF